MDITKIGDAVTWEVDGLLLVTVDTKPITFGGGNILFVYSDVDGTVSSDSNAAFLLFGLVDNVWVELLKADPKMVIADLAFDGDTVRLRFSGHGEVTGIVVESADTLLGPFAQETGASIRGIGHTLFEATMVRRRAQRFYRVVR